MIHKLACTGLSPSVITFSKVFHFIYFINVAVLLPRYCRNNNGLGLSPVARRYWGNHFCFLLLQVLRCFSSLRLPTLRYNMSSTYWVIPFGDLRIKGYLHLNGAFRSLSRPSSALGTQAFSLRSLQLNLLLYIIFVLLRQSSVKKCSTYRCTFPFFYFDCHVLLDSVSQCLKRNTILHSFLVFIVNNFFNV